MCDSVGRTCLETAAMEGGTKSTTLPAPVPKPRPPVKPAVPPKSATISTVKPLLKPKPAVRRQPPVALNTTNTKTTDSNENETSTLPPERPSKPKHLQQQKKTTNENQSSDCTGKRLSTANGDVSTCSISKTKDEPKKNTENVKDIVLEGVYDDVETVLPDKETATSDIQDGFHPAKRKNSSGPTATPPSPNERQKPQPQTRSRPPMPKKPPPPLKPELSRPPLPTRPLPSPPNATKLDLPQTSVAALAQKLKDVPMFPLDSKSNTGLAPPPTSGGGKSPKTSPKPSPKSSPLLPTKENHSLDKGTVPPISSKQSSSRGQTSSTSQEPDDKVANMKKKPEIPTKPNVIVMSKYAMSHSLISRAASEPVLVVKKELTKKPPIPPPYAAKPVKSSMLSQMIKQEDEKKSQMPEMIKQQGEKEKNHKMLGKKKSSQIVKSASLPSSPIPNKDREEDESTSKVEADSYCSSSPSDMDEPRRKISDTASQKKRIATRRQLPPPVNTSEVPAVDLWKRRPPPPPPASPGSDQHSPSRSTLRGPPVPLDRPIRNSAEEQSLYSYAYEHTPFGLPPASKSPTHAPESVTQEDVYTEPSTPPVEGHRDEVKNKSTEQVSSGEYEFPAEESVTGFMESLANGNSTTKDDSQNSDSDDYHDYIWPENEEDDAIDGEEADSFSSSDSEHDYELPPEESPQNTLSHKHSDSYDVTSGPDPTGKVDSSDDEEDANDDDDDYVEVLHEEPPDVPSDTCQDLDAFLDDDDDADDYEEPLYQVYAARTLERDRTLSRRKQSTTSSSEMSLDELTQGTLRNMRMLWCELPEVKGSGVLDNIDPTERKRQEAMFEVITSEASYLKSLKILESHFINSSVFQADGPQSVLEKAQQRVLFGNVKTILEISEKFLAALRERQRQSTVISTISDVIEEYATKYFGIYVKYCSHQIHQDRTLKELRKNLRFVEAVEKLEKCSTAQSLTLQSFLVLPMQRITRLPLLVDAICHRCEEGSDEFLSTDVALKAVNKIVHDCNEGARKMERMEELIALQPLIEFTVKPIALVSSSRWLLRRGEVVLVTEEFKSPLKKKLKQKPVYMFLFNDLLLICKKKSDLRYRVLDYANRSMLKVEEANEPNIQLNHMISLILLENSNSKTMDFLLCADCETSKTRWLEAFMPPKAEMEGERVYGAWDCPQVQAIHTYAPQQPDELALHEGDVINVQRKLPDGWYHGERLCDGVQGWFPANHTESIRNEHVRARNLLQRYRLLAASKHLIGATQTMSSKSKAKSVKGILSS